jgi:hypothetical protein
MLPHPDALLLPGDVGADSITAFPPAHSAIEEIKVVPEVSLPSPPLPSSKSPKSPERAKKKEKRTTFLMLGPDRQAERQALEAAGFLHVTPANTAEEALTAFTVLTPFRI